MRIISGNLKGRSINFLKNINTRPLKDSVRESIFNILKHSNIAKIEVENSNILDLYSGVGSFGIEALSRNANKVTFVEQDITASNILKNNLIKFSLIEKCNIITDKIEIFLKKKLKEKFNIFFCDPPFSDKNFLDNLNIIRKKRIFSNNHLVIIHRERKTRDDFKDVIEIKEVKQYGRSRIFFARFAK